MASLSTRSNGTRMLQFTDSSGTRRTIRMGTMAKKAAESIKLRVESLLAIKAAKLPMDAELATWVGTIGDDLATKLAAVGLIPERRSQALGAFLDDYLDARRADAKGSTVANLRSTVHELKNFFGVSKPLRDITEADAHAFRQHYLTSKLAANTAARRLNRVKQFFDHARKVKLIPTNPFDDLTIAGGSVKDKQQYITIADTRKLLAVANPTWRTIIALSRFAGLRCPSEVLSLEWEGINFETGRMVVYSPKTEHYPGKEQRVVPIFPLLRPYLEDAFELAELARDTWCMAPKPTGIVRPHKGRPVG